MRGGQVDANLACEHNLFAPITAAADLLCAAVVWSLPDCGLSRAFTSLITSCLLQPQPRSAPSLFHPDQRRGLAICQLLAVVTCTNDAYCFVSQTRRSSQV